MDRLTKGKTMQRADAQNAKACFLMIAPRASVEAQNCDISMSIYPVFS